MMMTRKKEHCFISLWHRFFLCQSGQCKEILRARADTVQTSATVSTAQHTFVLPKA